MALTIGDNFSYQGAKPLDTRLQYATIAEMASKADSTLYDGIMAYCKANGKNYQWKSTNTVDPTLGKWREFQSEGGGVSKLANLDDVDLDSVADGDVLKYDATEEKWVNGEVAGGAGRAKSTAIAPVFDETVTYASGDRVMYEDELYVFNTSHTGAWDAADADKSDVDTLTERMSATDMSEVASPMPSVMSRLPILFDESGAEQVVGWYKYANGTKKPLYQKNVIIPSIAANYVYDIPVLSNECQIVKGELLSAIYDNASYSEYYADASDHLSIIYAFGGNKIIKIGPRAYTNVHFIFQYTKTTDTPQ